MGEDEKGNAMSRISPSYVTGLEKYINELLNQVSTLKVELREICAAIDDPACDLTLTAVECIKKLKAENEWQPIETAPKDKSNVVLLRQPCGSVANRYFLAEAYAGNGAWIWPYIHKTPTHWTPLPKPPAMAQGEK